MIPCSKEDIDILRRWIKEGAPWGEHWAYVPVKDVPIPQSKTFFGFISTKSDWVKNPVDNFIEQKLKEQDLKPSSPADKQTLLRRAALDIIGMPAPENLAKKFLNDSSGHAYADLVDSLLASPHYGEKWTAMWLDLARYADTKGYERDDSRNIWHYRDWLIHAFNNDKPYDQFLTEQIAGDLLPDATDSEFIATAFHRNTMTNDEGGTDNEEFRTSAVLDRVNTTWQASWEPHLAACNVTVILMILFIMMTITSSWLSLMIHVMKIPKLIILCCVIIMIPCSSNFQP